MRCTQNPTIGEEWRKGWHPERIPQAGSGESVLIVGGGPCGLEAALAASNRSYEVTLAEADESFGGRVRLESSLVPLRQWRRVMDYRTNLLAAKANVNAFTQSHLSMDEILAMGCGHVAIATGSSWRTDFVGVTHRSPIVPATDKMIMTPESIMAGLRPAGPVLVFDDDHYYLGSALAEHLAQSGADVTIATTAASVSEWTGATLEYDHIQLRLRQLGVKIVTNAEIGSIGDGWVDLACVYTSQTDRLEVSTIIPVTSRISHDDLYDSVLDRREEWADNGIKSVKRIGDCDAPGTIAMAVYAGHEFARNLDRNVDPDMPFLRENDFEASKVFPDIGG